jgi:hypothetical protein
MMKKVGPGTSPSAYKWPVQTINVMEKVGPEIFPTSFTWLVQPM